MFATAVNEKDKRLIAKGRAETLAEAEAKIRLEKEKMAKQRMLETKKMANQMKTDGLPIPAISKYTGLPIEEIELL